MAFTLESSAFRDGQAIPRPFTCDGTDRPPPLSWSDPPEGTRSFALIMDDPDAPSGTFTHEIRRDIQTRLPGRRWTPCRSARGSPRAALTGRAAIRHEHRTWHNRRHNVGFTPRRPRTRSIGSRPTSR
ncbi:MAG: YbhB/YbcL family Raf kinase inhibitor-like protein [Vicinamibacterales bacterium]